MVTFCMFILLKTENKIRWLYSAVKLKAKEVSIKIRRVQIKMTEQLTPFSCIKSKNTSNIVCNVVDQVMTIEWNETKFTNDYQMTAEKFHLWPKDNAFQF